MRAYSTFCVYSLALSASLVAQDVRVTATAQIVSEGGRVTWGALNNLLAFDQANIAGFYDVWTSNPDGSSPTCLTCNATQFLYSKGNPEWHPSNSFLAVQIQWGNGEIEQSLYTPGAGVDNDLYIMDAAGKNYWPVTQNAKGVLHPRFSHSGNQLLWVQRTSGNNWNLMLADFAIVDNAPVVSNIQSLAPCQNDVFCETGGFSADDSTVFFTHSSNYGGSVLDIYSFNLTTEITANLTNSVTQWNEFPTSFPTSSPTPNRLLWMSGVLTIRGLETDYWTMNYDGSDKTQVTYYNDSTAPDWYLGPVSTAKFNWGPNASQIASYLIPDGVSNGLPGSIYILNVAPGAPTVSGASFTRPPVAADSIVSTFYPNLSIGSASTESTALPTVLSGTTALVTDALNVQRPAPLFFVSPDQVNWQIPADTAMGPATVQFTNAAGTTSAATINIQPAAPGLFTATATGSGPAAAYMLLYPSGSTQYSFTCSTLPCTAAPLDLGSSANAAYLVIFGTGLRHASVVSASILGQTLPVSFYGAQGGYPGLDQVNILLPYSFAGSGLVSLTIVADGVPSNPVQLLLR